MNRKRKEINPMRDQLGFGQWTLLGRANHTRTWRCRLCLVMLIPTLFVFVLGRGIAKSEEARRLTVDREFFQNSDNTEFIAEFIVKSGSANIRICPTAQKKEASSGDQCSSNGVVMAEDRIFVTALSDDQAGSKDKWYKIINPRRTSDANKTITRVYFSENRYLYIHSDLAKPAQNEAEKSWRRSPQDHNAAMAFLRLFPLEDVIPHIEALRKACKNQEDEGWEDEGWLDYCQQTEAVLREGKPESSSESLDQESRLKKLRDKLETANGLDALKSNLVATLRTDLNNAKAEIQTLKDKIGSTKAVNGDPKSKLSDIEKIQGQGSTRIDDPGNGDNGSNPNSSTANSASIKAGNVETADGNPQQLQSQSTPHEENSWLEISLYVVGTIVGIIIILIIAWAIWEGFCWVRGKLEEFENITKENEVLRSYLQQEQSKNRNQERETAVFENERKERENAHKAPEIGQRENVHMSLESDSVETGYRTFARPHEHVREEPPLPVEQIVREYGASLFDLDKMKAFRTTRNVVGFAKSARVSSDEQASLLRDEEQAIDKSEYWGIPNSSRTEWLIFPGRKQMTSAATLVADDGRVGEREFRGVFKIINGTNFECQTPASASSKPGSSLVDVQALGIVQLPSTKSG
jgi:hypothetical protein